MVQNAEGAHILLIDNASTDESVSWVKTNFPQVQVLVHPENVGFTGGYNLGIKAVETDFAVLLNSDVELSSGWLQPLVEKMESDSTIAACQPKILSFNHRNQFEYAGAAGGFIDQLGYPFCRGRIFDFCEMDEGQYDNSIPVFWATGACMMVRTRLFNEFGGFESRFFAHMEEIDLCWRWAHSGYSVWVEPKSVVYHLGGGTLAKTNPRKTFLNFRNGLALLFTNTLDASIWWKLPVRLVLDGLAGIQFLMKGESPNCWAISKAHIDFYRTAGYWRRKRNANSLKRTAFISPQLIRSKSLVFDFFLLGKKRFGEL